MGHQHSVLGLCPANGVCLTLPAVCLPLRGKPSTGAMMEVEDIDMQGPAKSTAIVEHSAKESGQGMVLRLTPQVLAAIYNEISMCRVDALHSRQDSGEEAPAPVPAPRLSAPSPAASRSASVRRSPSRERKPREEDRLVLQHGHYARVTLHVYDTSWLASVTHVPAFHVGVEVLGTEFSFGDMGINCNRPGEYDSERYRTSISLGHTDLRDQEVLRVLRELQIEWPGEAYRLNGNNCQTFAEVFCQRLGLSNTIPEEYIVFSRPWSVSVSHWGSAELKREEVPRRPPRSTKLSL